MSIIEMIYEQFGCFLLDFKTRKVKQNQASMKYSFDKILRIIRVAVFSSLTLEAMKKQTGYFRELDLYSICHDRKAYNSLQ